MFFVTLSSQLSDGDRAYVAGRIAIFSLIILVVSLFAGHLILGFFGISVGVLRCAGGSVLFAAGWAALNAPSHEASKATAPQNLPRSRLKAMAFFPFTLPLTTGPGAIAVSVALGTSLPFNVANIAGTISAIIATVIVIWLCYRYSDRVSKAVGAAGAADLGSLSPQGAKAYLNQITTLQNKYGKAAARTVEGFKGLLTGLSMAKLVDMDGDGTPELYCGAGLNGQHMYSYADEKIYALDIPEGVINFGTDITPCTQFYVG